MTAWATGWSSWTSALLQFERSFDIVKHINEPPVGIFHLLDELEITWGVYQELDPRKFSVDWKKATLCLQNIGDDDASRRRERVNVARGLAFCIMHPVGHQFILDDTTDTPLSKHAFTYAENLLMPRHLFQPLIYNARLPLAELSRIFDVPLLTVERRALRWREGRSDA